MLNLSTETILHLLVHKHALCLFWFKRGKWASRLMLHPQDSAAISDTRKQCLFISSWIIVAFSDKYNFLQKVPTRKCKCPPGFLAVLWLGPSASQWNIHDISV